ncbi:MAG: DNA polymerase III subunit gamma/tau, partial [Patescibacteria group bacterium]
MSKTLYRTYRPQEFSDVIGQDHIIQTLEGAIGQNRVGHAYLFTGPRGTGKTTVARIFATAINTSNRKDFEPVSKEVAERLKNGNSMDIIEIDAASNTGVDDIRELKETVGVTPTEAKFKVYIIDEVHMLSTNAFNALLKTLEEPPEHAIFILATTEIHKVPETILSRCQRFDFARFSIPNIIKKLTKIAKEENVNISEEALEMIAVTAEGGMRDAESLFAQVIALEDENITATEVAQILGTTTSADVLGIIDSFAQKDIGTAFEIIENIVRGGYNIETFIRSIIEKLRITLFISINDTTDKNVLELISIPKSEIESLEKIAKVTTPQTIITTIEECVSALQKTKSSTIPQLPLEVATVNICGTTNQKNSNKPTEKTSEKSADKAPRKKTKASSVKKQVENKSTPSHESEVNEKKQTKNTSAITQEQENAWQKCIEKVEKENKSLSSLLTQCALKNIDTNIIISTTIPFYKEKITQTENIEIIQNAVKETFGE